MIVVITVLFLLRIFGNSPTTEQMAIGMLATFLTAIYKDLQNIKEKQGEHSAKLEQLNNKNSLLAPIHGLKPVVFTVLAQKASF